MPLISFLPGQGISAVEDAEKYILLICWDLQQVDQYRICMA